jgi:hypothetical protein
MKTYKQLTQLQKDFATDKALEILIKIMIQEEFDFTFKSPLAQKHFLDAFRFQKTKSEFECIIESDEVAEELYPIAESMAEIAWYPSNDEYVLNGIV